LQNTYTVVLLAQEYATTLWENVCEAAGAPIPHSRALDAPSAPKTSRLAKKASDRAQIRRNKAESLKRLPKEQTMFQKAKTSG